MKIKEFLTEDRVYTNVEQKIRAWVESTYNCLSIEFEPHLEIVRTSELVDYNEEQVNKIIEVINIKIGDIMEEFAEEIYISEKLTQIWKKHPRFNVDVLSIDELKKCPRFLVYFRELGGNQ